MLIPVRCFCSKVIGHLWETYNSKVNELLAAGGDNTRVRGQVLDELGLTKYCCRRMLLTHVDVIDKLLLYSNNPGEKPPSAFKPIDNQEEYYEEEEPNESDTPAVINYQFINEEDNQSDSSPEEDIVNNVDADDVYEDNDNNNENEYIIDYEDDGGEF